VDATSDSNMIAICLKRIGKS